MILPEEELSGHTVHIFNTQQHTGRLIQLHRLILDRDCNSTDSVTSYRHTDAASGLLGIKEERDTIKQVSWPSVSVLV